MGWWMRKYADHLRIIPRSVGWCTLKDWCRGGGRRFPVKPDGGETFPALFWTTLEETAVGWILIATEHK